MNQHTYDAIVARTLRGESMEHEEIFSLQRLRATDLEILEKLTELIAAGDERLKIARATIEEQARTIAVQKRVILDLGKA